jgi:hypothetical protein
VSRKQATTQLFPYLFLAHFVWGKIIFLDPDKESHLVEASLTFPSLFARYLISQPQMLPVVVV